MSNKELSDDILAEARKGAHYIRRLVLNRLRKSAFNPTPDAPPFDLDMLYDLAKRVANSGDTYAYWVFEAWLLAGKNNIGAMWEVLCELPKPQPKPRLELEPIVAEDKQAQKEADDEKFAYKYLRLSNVPYGYVKEQLIDAIQLHYGEVDTLILDDDPNGNQTLRGDGVLKNGTSGPSTQFVWLCGDTCIQVTTRKHLLSDF